MSSLYKYNAWLEITIYLNDRTEVIRTDRKPISDSSLTAAQRNIPMGKIPVRWKVNGCIFYLGDDLMKRSYIRFFSEPIGVDNREFYEDTDIDQYYQDLSDIDDDVPF